MTTKYVRTKKPAKLVEDFNKNYKVGDTVLWRSLISPDFPYTEYIVRSEAILLNNNPVVWLKNRSSCCSIEKGFIKEIS